MSSSGELAAPARAELGDADLRVPADDLDEELLLRAEVVVEEPAAYAGLGGNALEGGAGDADLANALAHRLDDADGLVGRQCTLLRTACRLHDSVRRPDL